MADDFVLYNYDLDSAVICETVEDVFNFGQKIGFNKHTCDELVEKTYLVDLGKDYEVGGKKFVVWDDSFGGYHQYHASAKKSKSQPTFTDMVAKQRDKNKGIQKNTTVSYFYDGMEEREEIPDMMDIGTAEKLIKNRLLSPYSDDDVITALFSVMSNGNVEKYKKLWIERFQEDY